MVSRTAASLRQSPGSQREGGDSGLRLADSVSVAEAGDSLDAATGCATEADETAGRFHAAPFPEVRRASQSFSRGSKNTILRAVIRVQGMPWRWTASQNDFRSRYPRRVITSREERGAELLLLVVEYMPPHGGAIPTKTTTKVFSEMLTLFLWSTLLHRNM